MLYIDYSAKRLFEFCPWAWFERYVNKRKAREREGQRNDPLTLGSLVHKGLEAWYKNGNIDTEMAQSVSELNPTPECLAEASTLVSNYISTYPQELWTPRLFEHPLHRTLFNECELVAKIDGSFSLEEQIRIPGGWQGEGIELESGMYGLEHKTKSANIDKGLYVKSWQTNLQAAFQLLALREHFENVRGILVNVLEKPRPYVPKCVCKNCKNLLERATYVATASGHMCPICGAEQVLSALKGPRVERKYECWRFLVTREEGQLAGSLDEIIQTSKDIEAMLDHGMEARPPNRENCVTPRQNKTCEYFTPHLYNTGTAGTEFQDQEDYVGGGMFGFVPAQNLLDTRVRSVVE
jgi:hypothetical protein